MVSLGLLHGTQPDVFVVCHEPGRREMAGLPGLPPPEVRDIIDLTLTLGRRTNPSIRCAGVSLNTSAYGDVEAQAIIDAESARLGLPVGDPVRRGPSFEQLVNACLES